MTELENYDEILQGIPEEYKTEFFIKVFNKIKDVRSILSLKNSHEIIRFFLDYLIDSFSWFTESLESLHKIENEKCNTCSYKKTINNAFSTEALVAFLKESNTVETSEKDIYFIKSEEGLIKIGTSYKPKKRLTQLQQNTRFRLALIHIIPKGGLELEKEIHNKFSKYKVFGEWYLNDSEILEYIKNQKRGGFR